MKKLIKPAIFIAIGIFNSIEQKHTGEVSTVSAQRGVIKCRQW